MPHQFTFAVAVAIATIGAPMTRLDISGHSSAAAPPLARRRDHNGDPLPSGAVARLGMLRWQNLRGVSSLAISPDGQTLATIDERLRVWDVATGRLLRDGGPRLPAWKVLHVANGGSSLLVWDLLSLWRLDLSSGTKRSIRTNIEQLWNATTFALSPDNRTLAVRITMWREGKDVHELLLLDLITSRQTVVVKPSTAFLAPALSFSSDSRRLFFGVRDTLRVYDVVKCKEVAKVDIDGQMKSVASSPDGRAVAIVRHDAAVILALLTPSPRVVELGVDAVGESAMAFTADGRGLFLASEFGPVLLIDVKKERKPRTITLAGRMTSAVFSEHGSRLGFVDYSEGYVRVWGLTTGREHAIEGTPETEEILEVIPSPDGRRAATRGPSAIRVWDLRTTQPQQQIPNKGFLPGISWTPDGRALFTATEKTATWWNAQDGKPIRKLTLPFDRVAAANLLGSCKYLRCQEWHSTTGSLVDSITGKRITDSRIPLGPMRMISPDGQFCLHHEWQHIGSGEMTVHVDLKERVTGRTIWRQSLPYPVLRLRRVSALDSWAEFTLPDGRFVMLTVRLGFHLFESATGRPVFGLLCGKPSPEYAEFLGLSPDGRMIAVRLSGSVGKVAFIEVATGRQRRSMSGFGWRDTFVFASNGRHLITCSRDGTALVWDCYGVASPAHPITPKVARRLWDDLGGEDTEKAFTAMCQLIASPKVALPLIAGQLRTDRAITSRNEGMG